MPAHSDDLRALLEAHMALSQQRHDDMVALLRAGFIDGDTHGHRAAHEAMMERERADAEFWKKLKFELTSKGLFIFFGWLAYQAWVAFIQGPPK